jgi:hypothetical protein
VVELNRSSNFGLLYLIRNFDFHRWHIHRGRNRINNFHLGTHVRHALWTGDRADPRDIRRQRMDRRE